MPMLHLDDPVTPGRRAFDAPDPDADALFVFSSGTTGMPKAVRHTHGGFAVAVRHWRDALGLSSADRMQIVTPPSHILGLLNIVMALDTGAWIRLHRRFDIDQMLHHIEADRITIEMAVAPIALALAAPPEAGFLRPVVAAVHHVVCDAGHCERRRGRHRQGRRGLGDRLRHKRIAGDRMQFARRRRGWTPSDARCPGSTFGWSRCRTARPSAPGEVGEIQARSDSVMAGYLPDEATAQAFSDGWYRTGDVGYLDADGWLRITDRAKEMIKVRGFQVAPAEIEAVLHGHPRVDDCAVFGVEDPADGEAVVAAVAAHGSVDPDELIALVAQRLASYKRLSRVVIVPEIPRLPSGKVLRRVLKEQHGRPSDG